MKITVFAFAVTVLSLRKEKGKLNLEEKKNENKMKGKKSMRQLTVHHFYGWSLRVDVFFQSVNLRHRHQFLALLVAPSSLQRSTVGVPGLSSSASGRLPCAETCAG